MKNYIFLLLAIALIGVGVFVLGGDGNEIAKNMSTMAKRSGDAPTPIPVTGSLLNLSAIANVTGILSFVIQMGIWAKSSMGKK